MPQGACQRSRSRGRSRTGSTGYPRDRPCLRPSAPPRRPGSPRPGPPPGATHLPRTLTARTPHPPADLTVGALTIPAGCPIDALLTAPAASCGGIGLNLFNPSAGVFRSQPVTTTIKNPSQMALGVAYKVASGWTLLGDYQYTWWDSFNELDIVFPQDASGALNRKLFERYDGTSGFRFAAEWMKDAKWTFRGGYLYHGGAAPAETVTPLLPEGNRNEFTAGATVKLSRGLTADLAYQFIRQNDRRGRTREALFNQLATTGLNNGLYNFHAHLFGVSLGYAF